MADKFEITKELTLAIVDKINPADQSSIEAYNRSLASEVAKAYETIFRTVEKLENEKSKAGNYIG